VVVAEKAVTPMENDTKEQGEEKVYETVEGAKDKDKDNDNGTYKMEEDDTDGGEGTESTHTDKSRSQSHSFSNISRSNAYSGGNGSESGGNTPLVRSNSFSVYSDSKGQGQGQGQGIAFTNGSSKSGGALINSATGNRVQPPHISFPEIKLITPHEAVARLWSSVVHSLDSIHKQHINDSRMIEIDKMISKHNYFDDLFCLNDMRLVHSPSGTPTDTEIESLKSALANVANTPYAPFTDATDTTAKATASALKDMAAVVWAQMDQIQEANRVFRAILKDRGLTREEKGEKRW
jgi:hypothetical protein